MLHLLNNFGRPDEVSVSLVMRLGAPGLVNQVREYLDTAVAERGRWHLRKFERNASSPHCSGGGAVMIWWLG
jgi:hypothetical protein